MEKYKTLHEALIDEKIVKKGSQWQVQSEKGRNMGTYNTKKEAENRLKQIEYFKHLNEDNDFDDEIPSIVNPFAAGSEEAAGYEQALAKLAAGLFGEDNGQSSNDSSSSDPRLEPLPIPQKPLNPKEPDKEDSKNQKDIDNQQNDSEPLTQKEIADLVDKITKARDKARDVIDDYGDKVNKETADSLDKIDNELDKLSDEAKDAETEAEAQDIIDKTNKLKARLNSIATFWDKDKNKDSLKKDTENRAEYNKLQKELSRARANSLRRNYSYRPMTINEIVNNIVRTIKTQVKQYRDSDYAYYNPRSKRLGYVAPGRYNTEKYDIPNVVFYFDVSGSWNGNKEKIAMGHRIEEALKKLQQDKKINLSCFYFGTKVHTEFTTSDGGNSDAPIPHAIDLLDNKLLDNVIIMTDSDPQSNQELTVPGYAWLLFYDTISESLATNVKGKKGTSVVMIEHNELSNNYNK